MRAVRIEAFGEPADVLEHVEIPEPPPPAAGEVLIGVEHAPINMNDLSLIQGAFPIRPSLPSVAGNEGVGRVLALGSGVEHLKIGDHVLISTASAGGSGWSCPPRGCSRCRKVICASSPWRASIRRQRRCC